MSREQELRDLEAMPTWLRAIFDAAVESALAKYEGVWLNWGGKVAVAGYIEHFIQRMLKDQGRPPIRVRLRIEDDEFGCWFVVILGEVV